MDALSAITVSPAADPPTRRDANASPAAATTTASLGEDTLSVKPRVIVVANMGCEGDAAQYVLEHPSGRAGSALPSGMPAATRPADAPPGLRTVVEQPHSTVELYCLEDIQHAQGATNLSSSDTKAAALPPIFDPQRGPIGMVVAIGTGGTNYPGAGAGDVIVAPKTWMHDVHPGGSNPKSGYTSPHMEAVLPSTVDPAFFAGLDETFASAVAARSMIAPGGDPHPHVIAGPDLVGGCKINCTDYREYDAVQNGMIAAFPNDHPGETLGFLETMFPMVREAAPANVPFLSVAAIAATIGSFPGNDDPGRFPKNMASSFNAGVALGHMLPKIDDYVATHPGVVA